MAKSHKVTKNNKVTSTAFYKNEKFTVAVGVVLMLISIYLFLALLSFFIYGAEDISILQSDDVSKEDKKAILNWTAYCGANIAYVLVNKCLGVSAILIIFPLCSIALYLIKVAKKIWKWICSIW